MNVSIKGNNRPVFGERTNHHRATIHHPHHPTVSTQQSSSKGNKRVRFSPHAVDLESGKAPSMQQKRGPLKSSLRPTRRYGKKALLLHLKAQKPQRLLKDRLADEHQHRQFEPDASILESVASLLESKLAEIRNAHKEELDMIEQDKQKKMAKIYQECMAERKLAKYQQDQEDETVFHDLQVMDDLIEELRQANEIIRKENAELKEEIDEIKDENERLFDKTNNYNKGIVKLQKEIAEEEERNRELQGMVDFLKMRKKEYENARFEADFDIEQEQDQARELRGKIEKVVAEINRRCTQQGFAEAVQTAVSKDFASVDASLAATAICA